MSTRLGVHVTGGPRSRYGEVAAAAPAVVVAVGEGGALVEAKEKSGGRTVTVFRDQSVFHDAPPGIDEMGVEEAEAAAEHYWPLLLAKYRQNPSDFFQPTNELGGDNLQTLANLVAFETRLMELAERDRLKLAVGSPAGGSPGSWETWVQFFVPLIRRAGEGGHVYSRHAYGGVVEGSSGMLTTPDGAPADDNAGRPFREAAYLREQGIRTPMIITEAGQHAGYRFPGVETFMEDVARYDALCRQYENIWGFAAWTYGSYQDRPANIEMASARLAAYLRAQGGATRPPYPAPAGGGTGAMRGRPRIQYRRRYRLYHPSLPIAGALADAERLAAAGERPTFGWSADDAGIGDLDERVVELAGCPSAERETWQCWFAEHYPGAEVVFVGDEAGVSLPVPYLSQWGPDAGRSRGDCGPACVAMVARFYGAGHVTVDQAAIAAGQPPGSASTNIGQLRTALTSFGVAGSFVSPLPADRLRAELNGGRPVIALLDYEHIPGRQDTAYTDNHFMVVVGYRNGAFLVNDPDWQGTRVQEGDHWRLAEADLIKAINAAGRQGIVCSKAPAAPTPPAPATGSARIGLHAGADSGELSAAEFALFALARPGVVKVLSSHGRPSIERLARDHPQAAFVVRAFLDFGGRAVTPQQFVEWTVSDVQRALAAIGPGREVWVELHNEPNLVMEGLGTAWGNGAAFAAWLLDVLARYRQALPAGAHYLFPGLSPGGTVAGVRQDWLSFLEGARQAVNSCDGLGVHAYWHQEMGFAMSGALAVVDEAVRRFPGKPIWVTEASSKSPDGAEQARQYLSFWQELKRRPAVRGVSFFVASASHPDFQPEVWLANGTSRGIAEVVGSRP
jgi:hypothetical protein